MKVILLRNDETNGFVSCHILAYDYVIVPHGDGQGDISNNLPYLQNIMTV